MEVTTNIITAGVDEAGRGPLAGPVVAAAVILNPNKMIAGLADSKQLTEIQREKLFAEIWEHALEVSVGRAEVDEIDSINILQATMLAMQRAVAGLKTIPELVLVDGNRDPGLPYKTQTIIRGDETEAAISAASIIAKVTRDREMVLMAEKFPQYNFAQHKGYSTKGHLDALEKHGPCLIHRRTFAPVTKLLHLEKAYE